MRKIYCDCCEREIKHQEMLKFEYPSVARKVVESKSISVGEIANVNQYTSSSLELCPQCMLAASVAALTRLAEIREKKDEARKLQSSNPVKVGK